MPPFARTSLILALPLLTTACAGMSTSKPAVAQQLDWSAAPVYSTLTLSAGFQPDPQTLDVMAGGNTRASVVSADCAGFVNAEAPDVDINYTAGSYPLKIAATSASDTTLVVYDASGIWHCSDDADGTDPAVVLTSPPSGNYNVWVGSYDGSGQLAPATLVVSESLSTSSAASAGASASASSSYVGGEIEWGDDGSQWSHDGECDDPRFAGPGVASGNIDADRFHDASDCRSLYEQGRLYLR
ncbi:MULTISPECIES: hypothetical protein [unclassified Halomonas]|uniref:hypothetical protein n=1 Tax=unclassified Halomonas TaxID=2609666 RepID=UPI0019624A15|nr:MULTISPECIES: hypothetical protein [unclassified Halomonas]|tara:strand:+ start:2829 stop:3554 length:726 start_codon:yes stop_codon:yes gene_type:complete